MTKKPRVVRPDNWSALEYFGEALKHWAHTGDQKMLRRAAMSVDNIADCLIAIARGADASEVFRQAGRPGRQRLGWYHTSVVFAYWQNRVAAPHSHRAGIIAAQRHVKAIQANYEGIPTLSDASIDRYARRFQDQVFWHLENNEENSVDLTSLRAVLAKKSKNTPRGKRTR